MHPAISQHCTDITIICQRFHVSCSEVFGSAARADDFNPATTDVDFLIAFAEGPAPGLQEFFGAKMALENLLAREVDLIERDAVRNPCVLASINHNREAVYAA
jgi:predicted nucleotidyltransferase